MMAKLRAIWLLIKSKHYAVITKNILISSYPKGDADYVHLEGITEAISKFEDLKKEVKP